MGPQGAVARDRVSGHSQNGFAGLGPHLLRHVRNLPFPSVPPLICRSFEPSLIGDEYDGVACKQAYQSEDLVLWADP